MDSDQHGPHPWPLPEERTLADGRPTWTPQDHDIHRWTAPVGHDAPMVLDGPVHGDWFEAYTASVLVLELKPGDIVAMDNLSSHKRQANATCPAFGASSANLSASSSRENAKTTSNHADMIQND